MTTPYQLPEQLAEVTQEQGEQAKTAVAQELDALNILISEIETKRRNPLFGEAYQRRRGYEEMHKYGFGKTVVFDTEHMGRQYYRISMATSDYANTEIGYATPNSAMGHLCRTAKLGKQHESPRWGEYTIVEIRNFARFNGVEAADNLRNFRVMEAQSIDAECRTLPFHFSVSNLKAALQRWVAPTAAAEKLQAGAVIEGKTSKRPKYDPEGDDSPVLFTDTEDEAVSRVDIFGRSETTQDAYYGLSHYFFLNPTDEQLAIMTNSPAFGPMLVEGVAGSGKTCAALGRAKTLCDLALTPDDQQFNPDFIVESNIGFVRTGELVQYLKASCLELGISDLPIHEYAELEHRLSHSRNLFVETRSKNKAPVADVVVDEDDDAEADELELTDEAIASVLQQANASPDTDADTSAAKQQALPQYKYHNLVSAPTYDFYPETTIGWLTTISAIIGWRIAAELRQQLQSMSMPKPLKENKFLVRYGNGDALLSMVRERLTVAYQPVIAQLEGNSRAVFTLDKLLQLLVQAQQQLAQDLFDDKKKWVNPEHGQWRPAGELSHNLQQLRKEGAIFVEDTGQQIRAVLVHQQQDLTNLLAQGAQIFVAGEKDAATTPALDALWTGLEAGEAELVCRFPDEDPVTIRWLPALADFEFLVATNALSARRGDRLFKVVDINPFCRALKAGNSTTSLARALKQQLRAVYRKWQFADLYRDALLTPYAGDKLKSEAVKQRYPQWSLAAERLQGRQLAPHDKDLLLCLAQIMTRELSVQPDMPAHLMPLPAYRSVFIDEVQDFTEQQIFLMAQQADPKYHAVTLVGDMYQQLGSGNVTDLVACFPYQPLNQYLLKENKRQERQPQLAAISMLFRALVQNDARLQDQQQLALWQQQAAAGNSAEFKGLRWQDIDEALVNVIANEPFGRTIAVICPQHQLAVALEARLRDLLAAKTNRVAHVSDRIDLTKKYMVHFSAAENTKGLEFDTVIFAGLEFIDWHNTHQLNKAYVALSRARKKLVMFGQPERLPAMVRECLLPRVLEECN